MPNTIKAKLLLGWMNRTEAIESLNSCTFEQHLTEKKAVKLWKLYRDRVAALPPRVLRPLQRIPISAAEQMAIDAHLRKINENPDKARFRPDVLKVHPGEIVAKQFYVLTERSEQYAKEMQDEAARINNFLGVGLEFNGELVFKPVGRNRVDVDLSHAEFLTQFAGLKDGRPHVNFQERDRWTLAVRAGERLILWGGYHRTYALLCHIGGEADGVAPLLTVMTGIPEVEEFLGRPSFLRDTALGERPALLSDFLNPDLFIEVNLRKKRARGRIEMIRPGKLRCSIDYVDDAS